MNITKDQWDSHPSFRKELAELLKEQSLDVALSIVRDAGLQPTPILQGVDLIQYFAINGAKRDGYFEAITNLISLSKTKPTKTPAQAAWTKPKPKSAVDDDRTSAP